MLRSARAPILCALLGVLPPAVAAAENLKLAVIPTQFDETSKGVVPSLFDDYLLTAVQNNGRGYDVIGQEDIGAMLGFERSKELIDCSDTSCMADIGGALGVDKLVVVKIARLKTDWILTGKIINIKETRVESRVNEIVAGDVKKLLESVPTLVTRLFGTAPPAASPGTGPEPTPAAPPPAAAAPPPQLPYGSPPQVSTPSEPKPRAFDENAGGTMRIAGTILMVVGAIGAGIGGILMTFANNQFGVGAELIRSSYYGDTSAADALNILMGVYGSIGLIIGLVCEGIGAKVRVVGAARGKFGHSEATGTPTAYWLGWVLSGLTIIGVPIYAALGVSDPTINTVIGWGIGGGAGLWFLITGFGEGDAHETAGVWVEPSVRFARTGPTELTPVYGLGVRF